MKAVSEVGPSRIARYLWVSLCLSIFRRLWISPVRVLALRMLGARVGRDTVIHRISLVNVDRGGFKALTIGDSCFLGDEVLLDLAAPIVLESHVTLAARAMVLTHLNVGWKDHPLQARFPPQTAGVTIGRGSFVGAASVVLAGTTVGPEAFVGACSLVTRDAPQGASVAGVPARPLDRSKDVV